MQFRPKGYVETIGSRNSAHPVPETALGFEVAHKVAFPSEISTLLPRNHQAAPVASARN